MMSPRKRIRPPKKKDMPMSRARAREIAVEIVEELWADIVRGFASYSKEPPHKDEAVREARIMVQTRTERDIRREREQGLWGGYYSWRSAIPFGIYCRRMHLYEKAHGRRWEGEGCPPNLHGREVQVGGAPA